jgi:hypothetical protein
MAQTKPRQRTEQLPQHRGRKSGIVVTDPAGRQFVAKPGEGLAVLDGIINTTGRFVWLAADPASPANGDAWIKVTGSGPYEVSLNLRIAGATHSIPLYTTA